MLRPSTEGGLKQQGASMNISNRTVVRIAAVALFAVLVSPIEYVRAAAPAAEAPSVTLQYHSTDLDTPQGIAVLYRRIREAASSVCGPYDGALLEEKLLWNKCVDQAVARAVASVRSEKLSAYYWRRIRGCVSRGALAGVIEADAVSFPLILFCKA
jgi:UrcA family protein